jgi:hypothetical protein
LQHDKMVTGRVDGGGDELTISVGAQIHYEPGLEIQR